MARALKRTDPRGPAPEGLSLTVEGRSVPLTIRIDPRLRAPRLRVRMDGVVILALRSERALRAALAFAHSQEAWISARLAELPRRVAFVDGAVIPLQGQSCGIRHLPTARGGVWFDSGLLHVTGEADHVPRRVRDYLQREARLKLADCAVSHAGRLGLRVRRVQVRDTISRWGSCSSNGTLSFSWRLILAPPAVLDYVAAHEVVHLEHMHHGPAFWALVRDLVPDYRAHEAWLKTHGPSLHAYG